MQNFSKFLVISCIVLLAIVVTPCVVSAATAPTFVGASGYSILGGAAITNTGATTVTGAVGVSPGSSIDGGITGGTQHSNDGSAIAAQADATAVYNSLNQTCDHGPVGPTDLAGAVLTPGVYCYSSSAQISVGGTLHLDALGDPNAVWIFKIGSTLTTISGASVVFDNVGSPCNVFWQVGSSATLGTTTHFVGNIIAAHDISLLTNATVDGRILARGVSADGTVALDTNTISGPTCTVAVPVNGVCGTASKAYPYTAISFGSDTLCLSGTQSLSPTFPASGHSVTWTCTGSNGGVTSGTCTASTANPPLMPSSGGGGGGTPIAPLIDVVKIPSPLALPAGPGLVKYTYTVSNIGVVPMSNVTVVDDSCSPLVKASGDTNPSAILQAKGVWVYTCSTTLSATHTNTVTATGWYGAVSAIDIANATVVVGSTIVPPLIHVTKVPSPLALKAGGGIVTYTEKVTNPGTVPLSSVSIIDDKCSSVAYVSGDTNGDSKLDVNETWTYTCKSNLTQTTTNTVTVTGQANGLIATDFAIVTVVVAAPGLPNTGFDANGQNTLLYGTILFAGLILISTSAILITRKRKI